MVGSTSCGIHQLLRCPAIIMSLGTLALLLVEASMLRFTITLFLGATMIIMVYRLRTILGRRRGCFGVAEMSHSRSSCV